MTIKIDVQPEHLKLVSNILSAVLPPETNIWMFGSRVTGKAKPYSDLDLVIDAGKPLSLEISAKLASEFDESSLPYKVDVVDWYAIDDSFREKIESHRVLLNKV